MWAGVEIYRRNVVIRYKTHVGVRFISVKAIMWDGVTTFADRFARLMTEDFVRVVEVTPDQ